MWNFKIFFPAQFEIQAVDRELQISGRSLISKGEELVKCRRTQQNIDSAIDLLTFCLPGNVTSFLDKEIIKYIINCRITKYNVAIYDIFLCYL